MNDRNSFQDERIPQYIYAARRLQRGDYDVDVPTTPPDALGELGQALHELTQTLERQYRRIQKLDEIAALVNAGLLLDDILENIYNNFRDILPYNRIGLSLLENDGQTVRARWAKTDQPPLRLAVGYEAPLAGSSLETILRTGQPRIINDLVAYLAQKPASESTRLIVEEGIRSSLTCPLIANGVPVGFLFFSSVTPDAYIDVHVETFQRIAQQLSVIVEKGRLVSELVEQKAAIEQQNEELRRLGEQRNALLGMVAHDLRSPIAYIQMSTEFLLESLDTLSEDDYRTILADIRHQAQHMSSLLNDLLDVTQIEAGKLDLNPQPVDLPEFLGEVVQRHHRLGARKGTQVVLDAAPPGQIRADPARLRQVMDNLISNAVKYAPAGSTVRVSAERLESGWRIDVADQGPGILPEDRHRLFTEFARLSARPTGGESSTGLGLAITKRIVEAHGGEIGVASEPGRGATFWFTLPE